MLLDVRRLEGQQLGVELNVGLGVHQGAQVGVVALLQDLQALVQVALDGGQRRHDGWGPKAVRDQREVREVPLDGRVEDLLGPGVAERRSILVQQVHQLLGDHPAKKNGMRILSAVKGVLARVRRIRKIAGNI